MKIIIIVPLPWKTSTSFHVETCTDIPESVVDRIFSDILTDSLATGLLPITGALDIITDITKSAKVTIITARAFAEPVIKWFAHYLTDDICQRINIIAMSDHDLKVRYIQQHNLNYFIDDRAETCAQVAQAGFNPILFRQPWNNSKNGFTTVNSWDQIANLLKI